MASLESCCPYGGVLGFHKVYTKERKEITRKIYDLGNGTKGKEQDAYNFLLNRDFPEYNFEDGKQDKVLFSPPFLIESFVKNKKSSRMHEDPSDGEKFEAELLSKFHNYFEGKKGNITVLSDWNRSWSQYRPNTGPITGDQHDFIIFDGGNKVIVLIEAKCTVEAQLDKAIDQLQNQVAYFREVHGHILTPEWKIACVTASENLPKNYEPCEQCKPFLLGLNSDFELWWKKLLILLNSSPNHEVSSLKKEDCYKRLVGRTIGLSLTCDKYLGTPDRYHQLMKNILSNNKDPVSAALPLEPKRFPWCQDVIDTVPGRDKIFLTSEQKEVLESKSPIVVISGSYGTGKSLLLVLKAIEFLKLGQDVIFIVADRSANDSYYFYERVKKEFDNWFDVENHLEEMKLKNKKPGSSKSQKENKENISQDEKSRSRKHFGTCRVFLGRSLTQEEVTLLSRNNHIFWDESVPVTRSAYLKTYRMRVKNLEFWTYHKKHEQMKKGCY